MQTNRYKDRPSLKQLLKIDGIKSVFLLILRTLFIKSKGLELHSWPHTFSDCY